jgi:hypothetical protein
MESLNLTNNTNVGDLLNAVASGALITFENKALNDWQKKVVNEIVSILNDYDSELILGELEENFFVIRKIDGVFVINDAYKNWTGLWVDFEKAMNPEDWWYEDFSEFHIVDHAYLRDGYYTKAVFENIKAFLS